MLVRFASVGGVPSVGVVEIGGCWWLVSLESVGV